MSNVLSHASVPRKVSPGLKPSHRARRFFGIARSRGFGPEILLSTFECALGITLVIMVAAFAHWFSWLLPVAVLLYLLIVVFTALLCGFWQAAIVSMSAVVAQALFSARQHELSLAAAPANSITLVVLASP
jgi:hypothetical protein